MQVQDRDRAFRLLRHVAILLEAILQLEHYQSSSILSIRILSGWPKARVINVYSDEDYVLRDIYPLIHGYGDAAGINPVLSEGVKNIRVDAGHLSYPTLALLLFDLAVGN